MTTPNTRWGRLAELAHIDKLGELVTTLGAPTPEVTATEDAMPDYRADVFQVAVRPDGIWIHASLLRRWGARQIHRFMASCDAPSDFRRANPR